MNSPYAWADKDRWPAITRELLANYPIPMEELVECCACTFNDVFATTLGWRKIPLMKIRLSGGARGGLIGGLFEHLFIEEILGRPYGSNWRPGAQNKEPDLVYKPDALYSFELKTSSHGNTIWGASSKVHKTEDTIRKDGSGFYLVINYAFAAIPEITRVRFGWLDDTDWIGSKTAASASSRVIQEHANLKLRTLFQGNANHVAHSPKRDLLRYRDYRLALQAEAATDRSASTVANPAGLDHDGRRAATHS